MFLTRCLVPLLSLIGALGLSGALLSATLV